MLLVTTVTAQLALLMLVTIIKSAANAVANSCEQLREQRKFLKQMTSQTAANDSLQL